MSRLLPIELRKIRRRYVWLLFLAALLVIFFWDLWAILRMKPESKWVLGQEYEYLLLDMALQNAIFLPIVIAAAASRLCDIELKGSALKMLCTLEKRIDIYHTKLVLGALYLLAYSLLQTAMLPLLVRVIQAHLQAPPQKMPSAQLALFFLSTCTVSMVLFIIQQTISLFSVTQIVPLFVGVGGSLLGLFSGFFPNAPFRYLLPQGYYWVFCTVNIYYIPETRDVTYYPIPFPTAVFAGFCAFGVLAYIIGRRLFMGREI